MFIHNIGRPAMEKAADVQRLYRPLLMTNIVPWLEVTKLSTGQYNMAPLSCHKGMHSLHHLRTLEGRSWPSNLEGKLHGVHGNNPRAHFIIGGAGETSVCHKSSPFPPASNDS